MTDLVKPTPHQTCCWRCGKTSPNTKPHVSHSSGLMPKQCFPPSACEFVSFVSFRSDFIVQGLPVPECITGRSDIINSSNRRETERERTVQSHSLKDVSDCDHVCVPAARKNEKGRIFPREVRRNPGAEEKV